MTFKKKHIAVFLMVLAQVISVSGCAKSHSLDQEVNTEAKIEVKTEEPSFDDNIIENAAVSYLGPQGTYTEEAAQFFFVDAKEFMPEASVDEAIEDIINGEADYAVIPQENTLGGAVTNYVDALISQENVYVVGEVVLPIRQTLMGISGATLEDIQTVCSHAQGIVQTEEWRNENIPNAQVQEMESTAAAAKYVAESGDKTIAAVAAPGAAELYGLSVLAENVQITEANKTRFYVLSTSKPSAGSGTRTVFVATCEANKIDDIIISLHDAGMELVTIHDRPEGSMLGKYNYIIEIESESGITDDMQKVIKDVPELQYRGSFQVVEK